MAAPASTERQSDPGPTILLRRFSLSSIRPPASFLSNPAHATPRLSDTDFAGQGAPQLWPSGVSGSGAAWPSAGGSHAKRANGFPSALIRRHLRLTVPRESERPGTVLNRCPVAELEMAGGLKSASTDSNGCWRHLSGVVRGWRFFKLQVAQFG
jgi:hypothetical protein